MPRISKLLNRVYRSVGLSVCLSVCTVTCVTSSQYFAWGRTMNTVPALRGLIMGIPVCTTWFLSAPMPFILYCLCFNSASIMNRVFCIEYRTPMSLSHSRLRLQRERDKVVGVKEYSDSISKERMERITQRRRVERE